MSGSEKSRTGAGESPVDGDAVTNEGPLTSTDRAYFGFLLARLDGQVATLEEYCSVRPESPEELQEVALEWSELFHLPRRLPDPRGLATRLLDQYGAEASTADVENEHLDARPVPLLPESRRYIVGDEIGRGGMGAVFEVEDANLNRAVAMKVVLGRAGSDDGARWTHSSSSRLRRFLGEARVTGGLSHPAIVPVHELGLDERDHVFFTMRRVHGRELTEIIRLAREGAEGWTVRRALEVLLKVCDVVAFAHSRGITHRDLKPANVLVESSGNVYCLDWGLAREKGERRTAGLLPESANLGPPASGPPRTSDGTVVGTPSYMPPEQALGCVEAVGPRTDVYGIGAMLYHLLTGRPPFAGRGETPPREILDGVLFGELEPPSEVSPETPLELEAICRRAMARDPRERYPGAAEVAEDLRAFLEGRVVAAYESGTWAGLRKWIARHRTVAATLALALVVSLTVLGSVAAVEKRRAMDLSFLLDVDLYDHLVWSEPSLWPVHPDRRGHVERWLRLEEQLARRLDGHRARLLEWESGLTDVERQAVERIGEGRDSIALALTLPKSSREGVWRYLTQRNLVEKLEGLRGEGGWTSRVRAVLVQIERMEREQKESSPEWLEAIAAIRCSPLYDGFELTPQLGLWPLGPDPVTGLWEFGHWPSGELPRRDERQELVLDGECGLVVVLLPGGLFEHGAISPSPASASSASNVDQWAKENESPVEAISLDPFFLSKFELTRGQARRLKSLESRGDSSCVEGDLLPERFGTFDEARNALRSYLLELPTEAQWEYAARSGTSTPWYGGVSPDEVRGLGNLQGTGGRDVFDDELAPVGFLPPNPFGLHDVLGNTSEWCSESLGSYLVPPEPGDGHRAMIDGSRVVRGGNYRLGPEDARSARRMDCREAQYIVGLRPARAIDPGQRTLPGE